MRYSYNFGKKYGFDNNLHLDIAIFMQTYPENSINSQSNTSLSNCIFTYNNYRNEVRNFVR